MARKQTAKQQAKALDKEITRLYTKYAEGKSINVMDISKVFDAGKEAAANGQNVEQAVKAAVEDLCSPA